jgi:DNA-binding GntR family transcriptional regulator
MNRTPLKAVKRPTEKPQLLHERPGETLASVVYQQLRRDIIDSTHPPGARLRTQELSERYGVGPSPLREALNRLIHDGLVMLSDHKGFSVTPLSAEHLEELTKTRCLLTEIALRESIRNGDGDWEDGVQVAYNRLKRIPHSVVQDEKGKISFNVEWERAHREFHSALIAACGSSWIINLCEQLFDSADRYRHISRFSYAQRPRIDEHKEMVNAVLARDVDKAIALLTAHFSKTRELANLTKKIAP